MKLNNIQLSHDQQQILFHVLRERCRDLLIIRDDRSLGESELLRISELLTEEMCSKGMNDQDERNEYGYALEDLIGKIIIKKIELLG